MYPSHSNQCGVTWTDRCLKCCLFTEVVGKQEGKLVDGECFKLTASFVRERHRKDSSVPVCQFYEVQIVVRLE